MRETVTSAESAPVHDFWKCKQNVIFAKKVEFYVKMELEANDFEKKQLSYSTQHFGYTPDAFVDSIATPSIEIINENLQVS